MHAQPRDCSITHYRNMAIWISSNIDIGRSLNSRDSFPRGKFKNRAPTSCSPGPILWPPTISFELHAEMAEEIDLEMCSYGQLATNHHFWAPRRNGGGDRPRKVHFSQLWKLGDLDHDTLDRVEVTLVRICGRGLPTHQIRWKSEKVFVDVRTDGHTWVPIY